MRPLAAACVLSLLAGLAVSPSRAFAQEAPAGLDEHKPFAETHVILQVSHADTARHRAVLDIASNLIRHYGGPDMVDIEIIAFGAGVPLLLEQDNPYSTRIASLMASGVRFYVCGNTLDTLARKHGTPPEILPDVATVQTGVAFLIEEIQRGYLPVHP